MHIHMMVSMNALISKITHRLHIFALLLPLLAIFANAQSTSRLTVQAGMVSFPNPEHDSLTLLESYFSVLKHEFQSYQPDSVSGDRATRVFVQLDIIDSVGHVIDSGTTYFAFAADTVAVNMPVAIFNKIGILVKPGLYSMRLTVIDVVSKREGEAFFPRVLVPAPNKETLTLGGLLIAEGIEYVGEGDSTVPGRLTKNGFKILPNPRAVFSSVDSTAAVYGEIYNLSFDAIKPTSHVISYRVLNDAGTEFLSLGERNRKTVGTSAVISEQFDLRGWPVGSYFLEVSVLDQANDKRDTVFASFHIIAPRVDQPEATKPVIATAYDSLPLSERVKIVMYILTPDQKETLKRLDAQGQGNFLDQYWKDVAAGGLADNHTTKRELVERFAKVNQLFSTDEYKADGYLTDRGRIFMTYGQPDELDDFPTPRTGNPYQVWNYRSVKEGKFFIFEDRSGYNDFRLVHSNVPGEIYSATWQDAMTDLLKRQDQD